uniref:Uncharacterized protein n=1 Tax=Tetradesmus obliquus TaxID=3088 RepID=A0A383VV42_TETOB|eukprot:jgi/Sobl393_1/7854/SZX68733.1
MKTQATCAAASAEHTAKQSTLQETLTNLLLSGASSLLHLASASYSVLCNITSARQWLDSCVSSNIGVPFDELRQLNDGCNRMLGHTDCSSGSRSDLAADVAAEQGGHQLRIRVPAAAAAAAAAAEEELLEPGTPPQHCCTHSAAFPGASVLVR